MAIKLKTVGEYRNAILRLREYSDGFDAQSGFDLRHLRNDLAYPTTDPRHYEISLTKLQRQKIARHYDELQRHAGYREVHFQKFRSTKKLKSAQKAMGMSTRKGWKGVWVPQPDRDTPAKLVKRGSGINAAWMVEYETADKIFVPFDKVLFADLGEQYLRSLFAKLPESFQYSLAMGNESRERWRHAGNLEQMIRDLNIIIGNYEDYADFIIGCWVYRGGQDAFNALKRKMYKSTAQKRKDQEAFAKYVRSERKKQERFKEKQRIKVIKEKYVEELERKGYIVKTGMYKSMKGK